MSKSKLQNLAITVVAGGIGLIGVQNNKAMSLRKKLQILLGVTVLCSTNLIFSEKSNAITDNNVLLPSIVIKTICEQESIFLSDNITCLEAGYPPTELFEPSWAYRGDKILWWFWDPPVQEVTSLSLEFFFNPEHFSPILDSAGFFCSFTNTGSCPIEEPGIGTQPIRATTDTIIPGSAIGDSSINIGSNSVSVDATFSSPITGQSEDEIFFGMAFEPLFEVTTNTRITYSQELLPNTSYSLSSFSCTTLNGQNECGSDNFTRSFIVTKTTNEPNSLIVFTIAVATAFLKLVRVRYSNSNRVV